MNELTVKIETNMDEIEAAELLREVADAIEESGNHREQYQNIKAAGEIIGRWRFKTTSLIS